MCCCWVMRADAEGLGGVQVAELQQWPALRDVPKDSVRDSVMQHFKQEWIDPFRVLFTKGAPVSATPADVKLYLIVQVRRWGIAPPASALLATVRPLLSCAWPVPCRTV